MLELWVATHILVDAELHWKTFCNLTLPPASLHSLGQTADEGRIPIDEITNAESYALLCGQLRSATEKRAASLSKSVMNDLERRLLQRQQSGWFETFLVSLILLNCVERTCWLFRSWDDENFAQRWPLDKRPPYYATQGDRFSDILHMLLKMRSLPPKATPLQDGGILKAVDGSDENAIRWFDMIKITRKKRILFLSSTLKLMSLKHFSLNSAKLQGSTPLIPVRLTSVTGRSCCRLRMCMRERTALVMIPMNSINGCPAGRKLAKVMRTVPLYPTYFLNLYLLITCISINGPTMGDLGRSRERESEKRKEIV